MRSLTIELITMILGYFVRTGNGGLGAFALLNRYFETDNYRLRVTLSLLNARKKNHCWVKSLNKWARAIRRRQLNSEWSILMNPTRPTRSTCWTLARTPFWEIIWHWHNVSVPYISAETWVCFRHSTTFFVNLRTKSMCNILVCSCH